MIIVLIRVLIIYAMVIFALRLMGKRQIGELQPYELVVTLMISEMATLSVTDASIPLITGIIPILLLVSFEIISSSISLKSKKFRDLISGSPMVVIMNGEIIQSQLYKLRLSIDDLTEALRAKDIFDIREVQYAIVETNGKISVQRKFDYDYVTAQALDIKGEDPQAPVVIISDGRILRESMAQYSLTEKWLDKTLKDNKTAKEDVFLMTADQNANYYIVNKERGQNTSK